MIITFSKLGSVGDEQITYVVIVSRYNGKWILVWHQKRDAMEIPGGRRVAFEKPEEAARRELFEETGANELS
ncbi:MAG: NUDIX domain-containing protein [Bacillota bacterium]|jgi:8-oxo-dGTP diphosphatase|nr:NUDIX domain-containing protein [Bacillota bacterium]HHU30557.1 NUDIX domain-containing protein [Bacillota bacterium]